MRLTAQQELEHKVKVAQAQTQIYAALLKSLMETVGRTRVIFERQMVVESAAAYELQVSTDKATLRPTERLQLAQADGVYVLTLVPVAANEDKR